MLEVLVLAQCKVRRVGMCVLASLSINKIKALILVMVVGVVVAQEEDGRGKEVMEEIQEEGGTPKVAASLGSSKGYLDNRHLMVLVLVLQQNRTILFSQQWVRQGELQL